MSRNKKKEKTDEENDENAIIVNDTHIELKN